MSWTYSDEYYKQYTRDTWNEAAEAYDAGLARQMASVGRALLSDLAVTPSDVVLDIATGPGEPALTIAAMMADAPGATGSITGIDLSAAMIEIAARRAVERGLAHARFQVEDAEHLSFPDASFDVVLSRFGFQIITDPEQAAREIVRVLRPGGRVGLSVWCGAESNPGLHSIMGPMLAGAEPDENGYLPSPYEMGGPGELAAILAANGCVETAERTVAGAFEAPSVDAYWEMMMRGTPLGHSLAEEPPEAQRAIEAEARANIAAHAAANGSVRLPTLALLVTARKPL